MRTFLRILTFVLVGPPIGAFVFVFGTGLYTSLATGKVDGMMLDAFHVFVSPPIIVFGYVLGGIPAVLAGIVASIMARRMAPGWAYRGWVALGGAITSIIGTVWFSVPNGFGDGNGALSIWSFIAVIGFTGAVAAFVSVLVFDGLGALRRRRAA